MSRWEVLGQPCGHFQINVPGSVESTSLHCSTWQGVWHCVVHSQVKPQFISLCWMSSTAVPDGWMIATASAPILCHNLDPVGSEVVPVLKQA